MTWHERWLRDEAGAMETSGIAANAYDLADKMKDCANALAAERTRAERAESALATVRAEERESIARWMDSIDMDLTAAAIRALGEPNAAQREV